MFVGMLLGEESFQYKTGISMVDNLLGWWDKFKKVGHSYVLKKAAKKMELPPTFVYRMADLSLKQLQEMDDLMQSKQYLIQNKDQKIAHDLKRLEFVNLVHTFRQQLEARMADKNVRENYRKVLQKILLKKNLPAEEVENIINNSKVEDLRVLQILDIAYETDGRGEWAMSIHAISRGRAIFGAYNAVFKKTADVEKTYILYHYNRLRTREVGKFKQEAKGWKMKELSEKIDELEQRAQLKPGERYDRLMNEKILDKELLNHDNIIKAKDIMGLGKTLEALKNAQGSDFFTKNVGSMAGADDLIKKLYGADLPAAEIEKIKRMKGVELMRAFTEKVVDLKTMQDTTRARFAFLSNEIERGVGQVREQWDMKVEQEQGKRRQIQTLDAVHDLKQRSTPITYWAKKLALPSIFIGFEGYNMMTGRQRGKEMFWNLGEAAAGFVPILGTSLDFRAAIKGKSLAGKELKTKERLTHLAFGAIGLVADAAWVLGGLGAYLRAGVGSLKASRQAVEAGRAAKGLKEVAYTEEGATALQRTVGKMGSVFVNKAHKAESASEAMVTSKAYEQANIVSRLRGIDEGAQARYANLDSVEDIAELDKLISAAKAEGRSSKEIELLSNYRKMMETAGGVNYVSMFRRTHPGGLEIPQGIVGRAWMRSKQAFQDAKAWFMGIGVPAETLKEYERTYEVVQTARIEKEKSIKKLADAMSTVKDAEIKAADKAKQLFEKAPDAYAKSYAEASTNIIKIRKESASFHEEYKLYEKYMEVLKKAEKGEKVNPSEIESAKKLMNLQDLKSGKVTKEELKKAEDAFKVQTNKSTAFIEDIAKKEKDKEMLGSHLSQSNQWKKELDEANENVIKVSGEKTMYETNIRMANREIEAASSTRSMLELEMMGKAESWAANSDKLASAAKILQWGGIGSLVVWGLTAGKLGPAEQAKAAGAVLNKGYETGKKAGDVLFLQDHSPTPALDEMIDKQIQSFELKKKYHDKVDKMTKAGENPDEFYVNHWEEPEMQEVARKKGVYQQIQEKVAKMGGQIKDTAQEAGGAFKAAASKTEVAASDAASKLKDKISD
jgi:hypothetical protein